MGHIHSDSQYDYTASGVIVHDDKVLLLLHHKLNLWLSPAGHIELDETPIQGLFREVQEETGLTPNDLTLISPYVDNLSFARDEDRSTTEPMPFDIDIHSIGESGHKHIDFGYILASDTAEFTPEEGGATEMRWFTLDEIKDLSPTIESIKSRAAYAIRKVREAS